MSAKQTLAAFLVVAALAAICATGCSPKEKPVPADNTAALAGQAKFNSICIRCHRPSALASHAGRITNNMGTIASRMKDVTLTDEEIANLRAYLATQ